MSGSSLPVLEPWPSAPDALRALISRRRRQIHVHSVLYYHLDTNIVSDYLFDAWSVDLVRLQESFPDIAAEAYGHRLFYGWDGSTGMHFPPDEWALRVARSLLRTFRRRS